MGKMVNAKTVTFKRFLIERENVVTVQPEIKADLVDLLRSHTSGGRHEILYAMLKNGDKEKESFMSNFNRLVQRYGMDAIKSSRFFRNTFSISFHAPKLKHGFVMEVQGRFTNPTDAEEIYGMLTSKYKTKV